MSLIYLPTVAFICCLMSFLISVFYLIFWKSQRSKTIAGVCVFFAISYASYGFRLVCQLLTSQGLTFPDRLNDIFYVGWVFTLWLGVRIYGGKRTFHPALGVVPALLIIWDLIAGGAGIALPWHAIPENIAGTVWFGMAGFTMWRLYRNRRNRGLAALAILLWLHGATIASYPMTRATWFAPYGFTIYFLLSLAIGMGMMLVALFEEKQELLTEMDNRRLAEEALHRQNRLIETFFSQAVTPFFLMDRDYHYIRVNEAWAKNFKMNIEDFPGRSYLKSYPDNETIASNARQILDEVVRSGKPFQASARPFEFPNQPERGITYWDLILQPIFKEGGELDFLFFTSLDVTERKKAEDELSRYREHLEELVKERTVELHTSEAKYRSLVRKVQTAIVLHDGQGRILDSNPLAHHLLGLSADQLLGKSLIDPQWHFLREDGSVLPVAEYPASLVLSTRQPVRGYVTGICRPDRDEVAWVLVNAEPEYDNAGQIAQVVVSFVDISERKQMERELILREREYRTLLESVPDYIVRYNSVLQRIYVNPAWEKASGLSAKEVVGVSPSDIPKVPQPVVDDYTKKLRETMEKGASRTAEFTWVNANGVKLFLEYVIVPEYDNQGQIAGVLAVGRDITDRRQAEEKLKVSEERLRMTLEATQIGIWDWDVANDRYYASPIYYAMLGYEPKEGQADRSEWMQRLHPDDQQKMQEEVQKVLSGTCEAYSYEARFRHADGSYRWQWAFGYGAEYDEAGKVVRMLGLRMDIDQRKQMEKELSAYREHLEELVRERTLELEKSREQIINLHQDLQSRAIALEAANKELDAFAYTASHDLRAPLRHVNGFIELLHKKMEANFDEQSRHYMQAISDSAQKMAQLIDDLLSFSRMGRCALSIQQVDLDALAREIIEEFEASAAESKIAWNVSDLPLVSGDAAMLRIVLVNLISNAMKFSRIRQPAHIEIGSLSDQNSETVIYVRDNGAGFDMAYADKLFGVFQRLHRADEFEGTGIGLATVRRIIARHGGRAWANGEPDQGATFYIALPQQADKQPNG